MSVARNILLTGASGVIGTALLPRFTPAQVIALVHRKPVPEAGESVVGDVTAAGLGLDPATYRALTARVDTVVHCAAQTSVSASRQATEEVNVAGTREVVQFAADADAVLYHVSTAFVARTDLIRSSQGRDTGDATARPENYLDSKRAAEALVRASGIPAMIIRPSIVAGDSHTGQISQFQGLHAAATMLLRNRLPLVPIRAASRFDLVPLDIVADAIAELVASGYGHGGCGPDGRGGEAWITAGPEAPTAEHLFAIAAAVGAELGIDVRRPRVVEPEKVERFLRPVFVNRAPTPTRRHFEDLLTMAALFVDAPVFPTSLGVLPAGVAPVTAAQVADAFRATLTYLVRTRNFAPKHVAAVAGAGAGAGV